MEMKETYIAPEAELLCFEPMENIANDFWTTWGVRSGEDNGNGVVPDQGGASMGLDIPSGTEDPDDGDGF